MLKEHMLTAVDVVTRFPELVGDMQERRVGSAILNAGIAIPRHPQFEVERTRTQDCNPEIRSQHDIVDCGGSLDFNRTSVQREHQRLIAGLMFPSRKMQSAGGAYQHLASAP